MPSIGALHETFWNLQVSLFNWLITYIIPILSSVIGCISYIPLIIYGDTHYTWACKHNSCKGSFACVLFALWVFILVTLKESCLKLYYIRNVLVRNHVLVASPVTKQNFTQWLVKTLCIFCTPWNLSLKRSFIHLESSDIWD